MTPKDFEKEIKEVMPFISDVRVGIAASACFELAKRMSKELLEFARDNYKYNGEIWHNRNEGGTATTQDVCDDFFARTSSNPSATI